MLYFLLVIVFLCGIGIQLYWTARVVFSRFRELAEDPSHIAKINQINQNAVEDECRKLGIVFPELSNRDVKQVIRWKLWERHLFTKEWMKTKPYTMILGCYFTPPPIEDLRELDLAVADEVLRRIVRRLAKEKGLIK